jgi:tight adherence protein C
MANHFDVIVEILIFCATIAIVLVVGGEFERNVELRRRLGEQADSRLRPAASLLRRRGTDNNFLQWVQASSSISEPVERRKLQRELFLAGFESPSAPIWYVIIRFVLAIGLPIAFLLLRIVQSQAITSMGVIFGTLVLCGVGFLAPSAVISRVAQARRVELEIQFPDCLDLIIICMEAGMSLEAAFIRVSDEAGESHPRTAREFGRLAEEMRAGRSLAEGLRGMADRCDVAGIRSFVSLVIQSDALGASIAQTLRTYSDEMRQTRFLRAEERAMRIPVLMTIPLVACILPVIICALLLPAIIDVMRYLIPVLSHQH